MVKQRASQEFQLASCAITELCALADQHRDLSGLDLILQIAETVCSISRTVCVGPSPSIAEPV
jgi:hypothetical protein